MTEFISGTCFLMCPEKERWMRQREGLLHVLEMDEKTKHLKRPKADPSKIVKCFSRPAAGQLMPDTTELRPAPVLLNTVRYLLTKVATRVDYDWAMIYDFIFDRMRAIRQEIVIQRIHGLDSIQILEPIVRFHVYAGQRLCEKKISVFDPKINSQHLLECLKQLLVLYDQIQLSSRTHDPHTQNGSRSQMEAVYVLLHLGDVSALGRGLLIPLQYRKELKISMKISLAWFLKNYIRTFRLIKMLPPLLMLAALSNFRHLRRDTFQIMSSGYNSKILTFPGLKLQELLMYENVEKLAADCKLFDLSFAYENVQFETAKFKKAILLAYPDMYFTLQTYQGFLPDIVLKHDDIVDD